MVDGCRTDPTQASQKSRASESKRGTRAHTHSYNNGMRCSAVVVAIARLQLLGPATHTPPFFDVCFFLSFVGYTFLISFPFHSWLTMLFPPLPPSTPSLWIRKAIWQVLMRVKGKPDALASTDVRAATCCCCCTPHTQKLFQSFLLHLLLLKC